MHSKIEYTIQKGQSSLPSTLTKFCDCTSTSARTSTSAGARTRTRTGASASTTSTDGCVQLPLDELEDDGAIFSGITFMSSVIVAVATEGIGGVTVRFDIARKWAFKASRAGSKLV